MVLGHTRLEVIPRKPSQEGADEDQPPADPVSHTQKTRRAAYSGTQDDTRCTVRNSAAKVPLTVTNVSSSP